MTVTEISRRLERSVTEFEEKVHHLNSRIQDFRNRGEWIEVQRLSALQAGLLHTIRQYRAEVDRGL